jgi:thiol-disulfide isomerase/thioredoxin
MAQGYQRPGKNLLSRGVQWLETTEGPTGGRGRGLPEWQNRLAAIWLPWRGGSFVVGGIGLLIQKIRSAWKTLRANFWASLGVDVALIITVFLLVNMWQTKDLPDDDHTPGLNLAWLDDMKAETIMVPGEVGVVYFFAPWCFYCKKSIDNLDQLVASGKLNWARVVALDYENLDEVREFIRETGVNLPVLLGVPQTSHDWQIRGFPTYFVINGEGQIVSRSVGYSTKLGIQTRVWMNRE